MDYVKPFLSAINEESAMSHIRQLTQNTPKRWSGSGDDQKAAEYINAKMSEFGLHTEMQKFVTFNSSPVFSELRVVEPEQMNIASLPCCHIQSTPEGGLTTEIIDVGAGAESDYLGKDVRGKAVLVEVSYAPPTPEKARIAASKGASAIVCMNWGKDQPVICNRGLKAVWGNPTPQNIKDIPKISGLSISRRDGERIRKLCSLNSSVTVYLQAKSDNRWEELSQPIAILESPHAGEEFILISGHIDAWEPGVTCNATGNGVMLELARIFAVNKKLLKKNLVFAFWNGHEIAEAAGSTWYVDNNWDQLRDNCIANFTIDSPGIIRASRYLAYTSLELMDYTRNTLGKYLQEEIIVSRLKKIGDQSFMGIGIPSIYGRMSLSEQEIIENNGATLGWWNHTVEDTLDKADPKVIYKDLVAYTVLISELANADVLPYDFSNSARSIKSNLESMSQDDKNDLQLNELIERANQLENEIVRLNHWIDKHGLNNPSVKDVNLINKCLTDLSRVLTNPFQTVCDRYNQDSYGLSDLSAPIPLFYPVASRANLQFSTELYQTVQTMLIKRRNRISDALKRAVDSAHLTNEIISTPQ